jgi:hypothetical protein
MIVPNMPVMNVRTFAITGLFFCLGGLVLPALAAKDDGKIYKTLDENGNPVYSDVAPENAQQVDVDKPQTYPAKSYAEDYSKFTPAKEDDAARASNAAYSVMKITSPEADESIRNNAGNVKITFQLSPGPKPGHKLELLMDGKVVTDIASPAPILLRNVDRGTHQVKLEAIEIRTGKVVQSSDAVMFTLHRYSILNNPRNKRTN